MLSVLLIEADPQKRTELAKALRESGVAVVAVERLAEVERWPAGDVVVTDGDRFTPWWTRVGAMHVIVLADTPEQGAEACRRGAARWILRASRAEEVVDVIRAFARAPASGRANT
jgi:DNA-binding response OmpR family regulator